MISQEKRTGFVQTAALGINISASDLHKIQENWEGQILRVKFEELATWIVKEDWVPSGRAHVLRWLLLQANAHKPPTSIQQIDSALAMTILRSVLEQI